jgi:hypothetical protein
VVVAQEEVHQVAEVVMVEQVVEILVREPME